MVRFRSFGGFYHFREIILQNVNKTTKVPYIAFHVIFVRFCSLFSSISAYFIIMSRWPFILFACSVHVPVYVYVWMNENSLFTLALCLFHPQFSFIFSLCCCCRCFCDREVRLHTYFSSMVKVLCKLWRLRYIIWFVATLCKMHMLQFSNGWMDDECMCAYWTI